MSAAKKKASKRKASKAPARKKISQKPAPKKANPIPPDWINQTEAADRCGVSITMFQRYGLEPVARRGRSTWYTKGQVLEWIEQRGHRKGYELGLRDGKQSLPDDAAQIMVGQEKARLDLTREQAEGQRLKNAQMRRELAPVEMITFALGSLASQVSSILGTLPAKIKRSMPKLSAEEIRLIKTEIVKAQNACAKELQVEWDDFGAD